MAVNESQINRLAELIAGFVELSNEKNSKKIQDIKVKNNFSGDIEIIITSNKIDQKIYKDSKIIVPLQEEKNYLPSKNIKRSTQIEQKSDKIDLAIELALAEWKIEMINELGDIQWQ